MKKTTYPVCGTCGAFPCYAICPEACPFGGNQEAENEAFEASSECLETLWARNEAEREARQEAAYEATEAEEALEADYNGALENGFEGTKAEFVSFLTELYRKQTAVAVQVSVTADDDIPF